MKKKVRVVGAKDGWSVVGAVFGSDGDLAPLTYEPVIAWAIITEKFGCEFTHGVDPITVNMIGEGDGWVFKKPDGTFTAQCDEDFDTEVEVRAYLKRRENAKEQQMIVDQAGYTGLLERIQE